MDCSSELLRKLVHDNTKPAVNALMVAVISNKFKNKITEPTDLTNKFSQLSDQISKIKTDIELLLHELKTIQNSNTQIPVLQAIDYFSISHQNLQKLLNTDINNLIENIGKIELIKNENQKFSLKALSL